MKKQRYQTYKQYISAQNKMWRAKKIAEAKKRVPEILEREEDKIVYETKTFVMLPDSQFTKKNLHHIAFTKINGLHSIRDLRKKHIPHLQDMYNGMMIAMEKKYHTNDAELDVGFHFYGSIWILHTHVQTRGTTLQKFYRLLDIIENLEKDDKYYLHATL